MGLNYHNVKMLWDARRGGASFGRTLTIGHQQLALHPGELRSLRRAYIAQSGRSEPEPLSGYQFGEYSDRFFREFLEVVSLDILDCSSYEGATIVHDLNKPVSKVLWNRFDAVVDGGSIEHVFNFPVAIENLMRMTKVSGTIFLTTAANNLCGHGLYQFSPELMFRVFSAANGFELKRVEFLEAKFPAVEKMPIRRAYRVIDPAIVRERVMLTSNRPVVMTVEALKIADVVPFAASPQQSDYVAIWNDAAPTPMKSSYRRTRSRVFALLPAGLRRRILGHVERRQYSLRNSRFYKAL